MIRIKWGRAVTSPGEASSATPDGTSIEILIMQISRLTTLVLMWGNACHPGWANLRQQNGNPFKPSESLHPEATPLEQSHVSLLLQGNILFVKWQIGENKLTVLAATGCSIKERHKISTLNTLWMAVSLAVISTFECLIFSHQPGFDSWIFGPKRAKLLFRTGTQEVCNLFPEPYEILLQNHPSFIVHNY